MFSLTEDNCADGFLLPYCGGEEQSVGVCWGFLQSLSCWILLHRTVVELSLGTERPGTEEPAVRCTAFHHLPTWCIRPHNP